MNDRVKRAEPEWTRRCIHKGESSILDFIVVENGSSEETFLHVSAAKVGTMYHCIIWTVSRRKVSNGRGGRLYVDRWRIGELELNINRKVPRRDGRKCKTIFRAVGKKRYNEERHREG